MDLPSLPSARFPIAGTVAEPQWHVLVAGPNWAGCAIFRPDPRQSTAFLFPAGSQSRHHSVAGLSWGGPAIPARIVPIGEGAGFRLVCLRFEGVFAADDEHQLVLLAGHETGTIFGFGQALTVDAETMRPIGQAIAALLRQARAGLWRQQTTLRLLAGAHPTVVRAVLAALTETDFDRMVESCIQSPELAELIGSRLGDDAWLAATVALARWNEARDGGSVLRRIGRDLDFLGVRGVSGVPMNESAAFHFGCRRRVMPRKRCGLVATASNEGPYLLDWIAYHLSIGVEQVVIYSNGNVDGSDDLLAALARAGAIIWVDSDTGPGVTAQFKAYGHALGMLPEVLDCEWTLILDLDEYFGFDATRFGSINDYIAWQSENAVDTVLLNWMVFGPIKDEIREPSKGFLTRYRNRIDYVDVHVKSLFRTRLFNHSHAHIPTCEPHIAPVVRRSDGTLFAHRHGGGLEPFVHERPVMHAWINHYLLRSPEEMLVKWLRNRGDQAVSSDRRLHLQAGFIDFYIEHYQSKMLVRDERIMPCSDTMSDTRAGLLALPGVAAAQAEIERLHPVREAAALKLLFEPEAPHAFDGPAERLVRALASCTEGQRQGNTP